MPFDTSEPGVDSQFDIGNNADPNQHKIGRANRAIAEDNLADLPLLADDLRQPDAERDLDALGGVNIAIEIGENGRYNPRHQPRLDLEHPNRFPKRAGGRREFQADESSADHHDIARVLDALLNVDRLCISPQVADTVQIGAFDRQYSIPGSDREHQRFIRKAATGCKAHRAADRVNLGHLGAGDQLDSMALIEGQRTQGSAFDILLAGHEALGERRALVGEIGLVANQSDRSLIAFRAQRCCNLETGLSGSDDDDAIRSHCLGLWRRPHDQAVEFLGHRNLAAQPAVRLTRAERGVEHFVLVFLDGFQQAEKRFVDINVAGGTLAGAATLGDNAVDSILDGAFHNRVADGHIYLLSVAGK